MTMSRRTKELVKWTKWVYEISATGYMDELECASSAEQIVSAITAAKREAVEQMETVRGYCVVRGDQEGARVDHHAAIRAEVYREIAAKLLPPRVSECEAVCKCGHPESEHYYPMAKWCKQASITDPAFDSGDVVKCGCLKYQPTPTENQECVHRPLKFPDNRSGLIDRAVNGPDIGDQS